MIEELEVLTPGHIPLILNETRKLGRSLSPVADTRQALGRLVREKCAMFGRGTTQYEKIIDLVNPFTEGQQCFLLHMLLAVATPEDSEEGLAVNDTVCARLRLVKLLDAYRGLKQRISDTTCSKNEASLALEDLATQLYSTNRGTAPNGSRILRARLAQARKWYLMREQLSLVALACISPHRRGVSALLCVSNTEYVPSPSYHYSTLIAKQGPKNATQGD